MKKKPLCVVMKQQRKTDGTKKTSREIKTRGKREKGGWRKNNNAPGVGRDRRLFFGTYKRKKHHHSAKGWIKRGGCHSNEEVCNPVAEEMNFFCTAPKSIPHGAVRTKSLRHGKRK